MFSDIILSILLSYIYDKHSYEMRSAGLNLKKGTIRTAYVYDHRDICKRALFILRVEIVANHTIKPTVAEQNAREKKKEYMYIYV